MSKGWECIIFDDAVTFSQIGLVKNKKEQSPEHAYRYIKMENISNGNGFDGSKTTRVNATADEVDKFSLENNDFLFNTRNSYELVGKSCLFNLDSCEPILFNNNILRARFIDALLPQFVAYEFSTKDVLDNLEKIKSGTTNVVGIYYKSLKNITLKYPSLEEQKQIVAILDQAFAAIDQAQANIQQNIQNAQDLFQSKLNQIFSQQGEGWEERQLNKICEVKDGTHSSPKYVDEGKGIPFVTQKNILNSGISFENTKFINQTDHDDFYRRSNVSYGDILFSMIGANRGMACIVDDRRIFSIKNVGLIKASDEYSAKYLLYFLKSPIAKKFVAENSSGSAQGFIGLTKLREFPIPYTDIDKQRAIAQELQILNDFSLKIEKKYAEKLNYLKELKKSLLQKAFSGELTQGKQAA